MVAIYALTEAGRIRYVGKALDPAARLRGHLTERGETPKCRWVGELRRRGERPGLRVLELVDAGEAGRRELRWIRRLHRRGFDLVNVQGTARPRHTPPAGMPTAHGAVRSCRAPELLRALALAHFGLQVANDVR